ncbi:MULTISPECIES: DUF3592 domain-containing protein [unclassified Coleofasciculus]|uniref:DUF3592 domain-containing protein n=2 Tax=Cyanobacteriota TaxID=1117 RepID=UPI0016834953|nr:MULTISPECIES: DUF3592 domain-containing protein [unclassified Coleofasciculus]MBD1881669.1 DUF3592 domain-containing protein [Coleofasciculus sp. FACHB-T130]MBD1890722.1 DUF3592 domain-containing protein [Coleofasciculus sp. FACHB-SPT9]
MSDKQGLMAMGSIFFVVGAGMLLGSFVNYHQTQDFIKNSSSTTGTVIDLKLQASRKSHIYFPLFQFQTPNGEIVKVESNMGSNPPGYQVGQSVPIIYNPNSPNEAEINSFWSLWFAAIFLLGMGGLFAGIGLNMLVNSFPIKKSQTTGNFADEESLIN